MDLKAGIEKMVAFAEKNPLSMDDMLDMMNGDLKAPGDTKGYFALGPLGMKIVYCIEHQDLAKVRYLSISFMSGDKLPPVPLVEEIMKMIGFSLPLEECIVQLEEINGKKGVVAIREIIK